MSKREKIQTMLFYQIIALFALSLIFGCICAVNVLRYKNVTVEAGQYISAAAIAKDDGAVFGDDYDPDYVNHAGIYYFTVHTLKNDIDVKLHVKDTKAPIVKVKNIKIAVGGNNPSPFDFIDEIIEPDGYYGEFISEIPKFKTLGEYDVKVRYFDESGNKTEVFDVKMQLVYDSVAPEIKLDGDIITYVGEAVRYMQYVTLSDNCAGELSLEVDDSQLDLSCAGEYTVFLAATDAIGNKSESLKATVKVLDAEGIEDELFKKICEISKKIIRADMTKEEQCRAIYSYVQNNISYSSSSDKSSWQREAYSALFIKGEGDCFSYFSASKAFFEYLGIENLDVERMKGHTADTHFWSLVNIGNEESDIWYHFDATRLRAQYNHSGCLLTDKQTEAYSKLRDSFYLYDKENYPKVATKIITPTPSLEKYY